MPNYNLFTCPSCEEKFRVIWPNPLPTHCHKHSKIKISCSCCGEVSELYAFFLDTIMQAPEPDTTSIEVLSISPRDPRPDPDASIKWRQEIFIQRAARFKKMYGN